MCHARIIVVRQDVCFAQFIIFVQNSSLTIVISQMCSRVYCTHDINYVR